MKSTEFGRICRAAENWWRCLLPTYASSLHSPHNVVTLADPFQFSLFTRGRENSTPAKRRRRNFPAIFLQLEKPPLCVYNCFHIRCESQMPLNYQLFCYVKTGFLFWMENRLHYSKGPNQTKEANGRINVSSNNCRLRPWKDTSVRDVIW